MARQWPPEQRIEQTLAAIERRFGARVVARFREARARAMPGPTIPSGSLALDRATGIGGFPRAHVTELVGPPSSGKSALLFAGLVATQRAGGLAALVDAAGTADDRALRACGVDVERLILARPVSATEAVILATILAKGRAIDYLAFSSVPALRDLPAGRLRPTRGDHSLYAVDVGRLLARGLRVLTAVLTGGPTAVVLTNEPLGVPGRGAADTALRAAGGLALAHFAALRIGVAPLAALPDPAGGRPGLRVGLTIVKHKVGRPGGTATVDLWPGRGLDPAAELLALGMQAGIVSRDWRGFRLADRPLGHRPADAAATLLADRALAARVRAAILAAGDPDRAA